MLRAGDVDKLRFTFDRLHRDSQWMTIQAMLDQLDEAEAIDVWMERLWDWYRAGREGVPRIVLIHGLIRQAWGRRGGGPGSSVGEADAADFFAHLEEAERLLAPALQAEPDHLDLHSQGLILARGLGMELEEHWVRFRRLIALAPLHYRGHMLMLENLKGKWSGSHQAMFRFAHARAAQAPEGSSLPALVAEAHLEMRNLRYWMGDEAANDYFAEDGVGEEIAAAWQRSLGSDKYADEKNGESLANLFAATLYLSGRDDPARQALALMAGQCESWPWCTLAVSPKEKSHPGWIVDRIQAALGSHP
jgi:pimeloyl-ACP methyl ester carboxylesterase